MLLILRTAKNPFLIYLIPFIPLSLRGVKGEGEFFKRGASPLLDAPFQGEG